MTREVFVVPHTHWDREWYQPLELFRWRLVQMVDSLLDHMEANPDYRCFNLDGQSIVIDDYLHFRPESEGRLRALVESGRVLIGPWWVQPDEFLPTGESHIRNLQRGIRYAGRVGGSMRIGHCADQFGHIAQMPQLMAQLGLTSACLWRGVPDTLPGWSFWWEAPDGTRLPVLYLRDSYSSAWRLPLEPEHIREFARHAARDRGPGEPALLMNGTDHSRFEPHVPGALAAASSDDYHFRLATLAEYEAALAAAGFDDHVHRGELRSPDRSNVLVGVTSARMNLKQRDFQVQSWLERYAEPLELLAFLHGGPDAAPALRQAWDLQLENAPHDSICGCSIDQVHREMLPRFDRAEALARQVAHESLAFLAGGMQVEASGALAVFRPVPHASAVVEMEVPAAWDIEALALPDGTSIPVSAAAPEPGEVLNDVEATPVAIARILDFIREGRYEQFNLQSVRHSLDGGLLQVDVDAGSAVGAASFEDVRADVWRIVREGRAERARFIARRPARRRVTAVLPPSDTVGVELLSPVAAPDAGAEVSSAPGRITSEFYEVRYEDGSLHIRDRETGLEISGVGALLDEGDRGDEYNADIIPDAGTASVREAALLEAEDDGVAATLRYRTTITVPPALAPDRASRAGEPAPLIEVTTTVTLHAGLKRVDFRFDVDNRARDHRLRALVPLPFATGHAVTENQFHVAQRPLAREPWNGEGPEEPPSTFPQKAFAAFESEGRGLAVFNRGLPEGEVVERTDGSHAYVLTLLRCVGWLSRADLRSRRGHAGPQAATFDSQLQGSHSFECALVTYEGDWRLAGILPRAHAYAHPPLAAAVLPHTGDPVRAAPLVRTGSPGLVPSAICRSEVDGAPLSRFWSAAAEPATFAVEAPAGKEPRQVDLLDRDVGEVAEEDGRWQLPLRPWEIASCRFTGTGTGAPAAG